MIIPVGAQPTGFWPARKAQSGFLLTKGHTVLRPRPVDIACTEVQCTFARPQRFHVRDVLIECRDRQPFKLDDEVIFMAGNFRAVITIFG